MALYLGKDPVSAFSGTPTAPTGGVSSWNDLTDKPFSYTTELREVIPEETCTVEDAYYYYSLEGEYYLEAGKDYILTVNGVDYPLTAYISYDWGCIALGDLDVFDKEEGGDENTFFIENYAYDGSTYFYAVVPGDYTISVHAIDDIIQPINEKVIPDTIARKDNISWNDTKDKPFYDMPALDDILPIVEVPEDSNDFSDSVYWTSLDNLPFSKPLVEGNEYTVYFDYSPYRLIAKPNPIPPAAPMSLNEPVSLCIGNLALVDAGEPSSEPFLIVYNCRVTGDIYTHGIELYVDNNYYTSSIGIAEDAIAAIPLDEKYLPYGEKRTILTWDGDTEGCTFVPFYPDDSSGRYKISDRIFTNDQIRGLKYTFSNGVTYSIHDGDWEYMVKAGRVTDDIVEDSHGYIAIVRKAGAASNSYPDMVYPEVGVYVYAEPAYYWYVNYVDFGMVTTYIDEKCIPDTIGSGSNVMIIHAEAVDNAYGDGAYYTIDKTFDAVETHVANGGIAYVKFNWGFNSKQIAGQTVALNHLVQPNEVYASHFINGTNVNGGWELSFCIESNGDAYISHSRCLPAANGRGTYLVGRTNFDWAIEPGPIVYSPNGTRYKIIVDDNGAISTTKA